MMAACGSATWARASDFLAGKLLRFLLRSEIDRARGHHGGDGVLVDHLRHRVTQQNNVLIEGLDLALRSEEHTSELQSQSNLVCRLLLEKKKKKNEYTENMS